MDYIKRTNNELMLHVKQILEDIIYCEENINLKQNIEKEIFNISIDINSNRRNYLNIYKSLYNIEGFVYENIHSYKYLEDTSFKHFLTEDEIIIFGKLLIFFGICQIKLDKSKNKFCILSNHLEFTEVLDILMEEHPHGDFDFSRDNKIDNILKALDIDFIDDFSLVNYFLERPKTDEYIQKSTLAIENILRKEIKGLTIEEIHIKTGYSHKRILSSIKNSSLISHDYYNGNKYSLTKGVDLLEGKIMIHLNESFDKYDGYCNIDYLFNKLRLPLAKQNIKSPLELYSLLRRKDYAFFEVYPHITAFPTHGMFKDEQFIKKLYSKDSVINIFKMEEKLSECFASKKKKNRKLRIIRFAYNHLFRIDYEEFVFPEKIYITDDILLIIKEKIEEQFSNHNYLNPKDIDYLKLPDISYSWNRFLLKDIVKRYFRNEFQIIEFRKDKNDFDERFVVVKLNSQISNFYKLIDYAIEVEYENKNKMTLNHIEDFLRYEKELITSRLPEEIKRNISFSIDDYGRLYKTREA